MVRDDRGVREGRASDRHAPDINAGDAQSSSAVVEWAWKTGQDNNSFSEHSPRGIAHDVAQFLFGITPIPTIHPQFDRKVRFGLIGTRR
jgi:hypothetical protein